MSAAQEVFARSSGAVLCGVVLTAEPAIEKMPLRPTRQQGGARGVAEARDPPSDVSGRVTVPIGQSYLLSPSPDDRSHDHILESDDESHDHTLESANKFGGRPPFIPTCNQDSKFIYNQDSTYTSNQDSKYTCNQDSKSACNQDSKLQDPFRSARFCSVPLNGHYTALSCSVDDSDAVMASRLKSVPCDDQVSKSCDSHVSDRQKLLLQYVLESSGEDDTDSLVDFEWDDTLLDSCDVTLTSVPATPLSIPPLEYSTSPTCLLDDDISTISCNSTHISTLSPFSSRMTTPRPHPLETPLPPLTNSTPPPTPLPPLSTTPPPPTPLPPLTNTPPPPTPLPPLTSTPDGMPCPLFSDEMPLLTDEGKEGVVSSGCGLIPVTVSRVSLVCHGCYVCGAMVTVAMVTMSMLPSRWSLLVSCGSS